jgi:adenosylcobinamide kinase/adenosylcobinamide-phosphate guanylyltransferase
VDGLLTLIRQLGLTAIVVSNEVGLGVVPPYPLGRRYRDALGRVNRAFAAHADRVLLLVAGLPIDLLALVPPELRPILTARGPGESE